MQTYISYNVDQYNELVFLNISGYSVYNNTDDWYKDIRDDSNNEYTYNDPNMYS